MPTWTPGALGTFRCVQPAESTGWRKEGPGLLGKVWSSGGGTMAQGWPVCWQARCWGSSSLPSARPCSGTRRWPEGRVAEGRGCGCPGC